MNLLLVSQLLERHETHWPTFQFCGHCGTFVESMEAHLGGGLGFCARRSDTPVEVIEAWKEVARLVNENK
jgi:hypothetical protein